MKQHRIIAGTMTWGLWGKGLSLRDMAHLITEYHHLGIYRYDHADIYGGYTTEAQWGKAYVETGIPRQELQIISKCGIMLPAPTRPDIKYKHYDHTYEHIVASAIRSIDLLRCGYLDTLLIHRPGPLMQYDQIAVAINYLKSNGLIKSAGVSNFTRQQLGDLAQYLTIEAHQIELSVEAHQPLTDGLIDQCTALDLECMAWSPLAGGRILDADYPLHIRLAALADQWSMSVDELAYAFLAHHPAQISAVVGTTAPARLQTAIQAYNHTITDAQWYQIYTAALGHEVP